MLLCLSYGEQILPDNWFGNTCGAENTDEDVLRLQERS